MTLILPEVHLIDDVGNEFFADIIIDKEELVKALKKQGYDLINNLD